MVFCWGKNIQFLNDSVRPKPSTEAEAEAEYQNSPINRPKPKPIINMLLEQIICTNVFQNWLPIQNQYENEFQRLL